jgi:predicted Zn-dependent protease
MGNPKLAEDDLAMALAEAPREWEYWHRFAQALAAQGKHEAAAAAARNAAALKPRIRRPVWGLGGVATAIATLRFPHMPTAR